MCDSLLMQIHCDKVCYLVEAFSFHEFLYTTNSCFMYMYM